MIDSNRLGSSRSTVRRRTRSAPPVSKPVITWHTLRRGGGAAPGLSDTCHRTDADRVLTIQGWGQTRARYCKRACARVPEHPGDTVIHQVVPCQKRECPPHCRGSDGHQEVACIPGATPGVRSTEREPHQANHYHRERDHSREPAIGEFSHPLILGRMLLPDGPRRIRESNILGKTRSSQPPVEPEPKWVFRGRFENTPPRVNASARGHVQLPRRIQRTNVTPNWCLRHDQRDYQ